MFTKTKNKKIQIFKKNFGILFVSIVCFAVCAIVLSSLVVPRKYEGQVDILVGKENISSRQTVQDNEMVVEQDIQMLRYLATSDSVLRGTLSKTERRKKQDISEDEINNLKNRVFVTEKNDSQVVTLSVLGRNKSEVDYLSKTILGELEKTFGGALGVASSSRSENVVIAKPSINLKDNTLLLVILNSVIGFLVGCGIIKFNSQKNIGKADKLFLRENLLLNDLGEVSHFKLSGDKYI